MPSRLNACLKACLVLLLPLALAGCFLAPGKFTSTLDIRADRSFTFTYVGEVIAMSGKDATATDGAAAKPAPKGDGAEEAGRLRALAAALAQEYGYRSVRYIGNHRLAIDYAISGKLDRGFIYPFNVDAEVLVPFLAIELRGKDRVRLKAPGFANEKSEMGGMGGPASLPGGANPGDALDGTFTLTTDAEIVSQNQEDGPKSIAGSRRQIVWRATPATKDAPMAVLKLAALP